MVSLKRKTKVIIITIIIIADKFYEEAKGIFCEAQRRIILKGTCELQRENCVRIEESRFNRHKAVAL